VKVGTAEQLWGAKGEESHSWQTGDLHVKNETLRFAQGDKYKCDFFLNAKKACDLVNNPGDAPLTACVEGDCAHP
jgi:hypothetical protein